VIIDTSALIAIVRQEADGPAFARLIADAFVARLSAASLLELSIVVDGFRDPAMSGVLDAVLASSAVVIEPFTERQAALARDAYRRFGKGSGHPARLNMGDCFSYALAHDLGEPLLFKGDDFRLTDIEFVTTPIRQQRLSDSVASYR
jgi:ribonuclease VapC